MTEGSFPWLQIMAELDSSVAPFNAELQEAVLTHKVELDAHFPKTTNNAKRTYQHPVAALHSLPVLDDEDCELARAVSELKNNLLSCKARNEPAIPSPSSRPPTSVCGDDIDSVQGGFVTPQAGTSANSAKKRQEAKLRLVSMSYSSDGGVTLPDLNDQILETINHGQADQANSFANLLTASNNNQAGSLDCINRYTRWPSGYRYVA